MKNFWLILSVIVISTVIASGWFYAGVCYRLNLEYACKDELREILKGDILDPEIQKALEKHHQKSIWEFGGE